MSWELAAVLFLRCTSVLQACLLFTCLKEVKEMHAASVYQQSVNNLSALSEGLGFVTHS